MEWFNTRPRVFILGFLAGGFFAYLYLGSALIRAPLLIYLCSAAGLVTGAVGAYGFEDEADPNPPDARIDEPF